MIARIGIVRHAKVMTKIFEDDAMARIPESEIERLKSEVSVQRLVDASGVELKRGGKDWLGRCQPLRSTPASSPAWPTPTPKWPGWA